MKKFFAILMTLALMLSLAVPAFADMEGTLPGGSITINDAVSGQTYSAYQILYLESYNAESGAYAYKANSAWAEWLKDQDDYVIIDSQGYVQWKTGANVADFAAAAKAFADFQNMTADKTATADSTTVKLENLNLGYYLVDTTLGTLCSLDTTNPNAVMEEKNEVPTITKEVEEDSNNKWGETNDADINQTVNFRATITVQTGAENYVMHDKMSAGLTYTGVTAVEVDGTAVDIAKYTVTTPGTETEKDEKCTFEVSFDNSYIASLAAGTKIVVSYSATLNEEAVVGLSGNPNEVVLQYGDKNQPTYTPEAETITYTWDMEVLKYANNIEANTLDGVKFVLINAATGKVATVKNGKLIGWEAVPAADANGNIAWADNMILTTANSGKISIDGLDKDTYYLREIETLPGYNKLAEDVTITVVGATETSADDATLKYETVIAKVNNNSGTELPSTGGMGTTIFYIVGGVMVVAAVVLLITKKRMSAEG